MYAPRDEYELNEQNYSTYASQEYDTTAQDQQYQQPQLQQQILGSSLKGLESLVGHPQLIVIQQDEKMFTEELNMFQVFDSTGKHILNADEPDLGQEY